MTDGQRRLSQRHVDWRELRVWKEAVLALLTSFLWIFPDVTVAQEVRSIFRVLETNGTITVGQKQMGALTERDLLGMDGRPFQVWSLDAHQDQVVQVDLRSNDFDTLLTVVGPGLDDGLQNDDWGMGLDSRICFVPDQPGEYRVVVSSYGSEIGGFEVSATYINGTCEDGAGPTYDNASDEIEDLMEALATDGRSIGIGHTESHELADSDKWLDSFIQTWLVEGVAGQQFSVDLLSEDFDPELLIVGPVDDSALAETSGFNLILNYDDDGAGGCNSRISLTFSESGNYFLVVSSADSRLGSYRLVASATPGPESSDPCF